MKNEPNRLLPPAWVLLLIAFALALWLASQLREILVLLIVGYSLAYIIEPLVSWLERRRIKRTTGVVAVIIGFALLVVLLLLTALPTVLEQSGNLAANIESYLDTSRSQIKPIIDKLREIVPFSDRGDINASSAQAFYQQIGGDNLRKISSAIFSTLMGGYSATLTLLNLFLLPFIVYYLSIDFKGLHSRSLLLFPPANRSSVRKLALEIDRNVSAFVRGQLTVCSVLFLLYFLALKILGVQLWLLISVVAGFGNMIPYLGTATGIILATLMTLVTFGTFSSVLSVWGAFALIQFLEGTFITPGIIGKNVGMSPLTIILAIFAGGKLFGLLGLFLAIPMAAVVKVLMRKLHANIIKASA